MHYYLNCRLTECFKTAQRAEGGQASAVVDGDTEAVRSPRQEILIANCDRRIVGTN